MAEPEVVPPLSEGVPDLQQAGADAAPVVPAERLPLDLPPRVVGENPVVVEGGDEVVPRRAGVPLGGGCHVHVAPGEVGRQRIPLAPVLGVSVEEGQQGAIRDCLPSHSQPSQASSSWRSAAAMSVGSMRSKGPWVSLSRDRASSYTGPPALKCATASWAAPSSGGCHRTVAAACPHLRISVARSTLAA